MTCNKFRKFLCEEECKINNSDKYIQKLKGQKEKLHRNYIIAICVGVIVLLVTWITKEQSGFETMLSFASTITSIILSVLAIIITITGESKMERQQSKMEDITEELQQSLDTLEGLRMKIQDNQEELSKSIRTLEGKVQLVYERIYEFKRDSINTETIKVDSVDETKWQEGGQKNE